MSCGKKISLLFIVFKITLVLKCRKQLEILVSLIVQRTHIVSIHIQERQTERERERE